MFTKCNNESDVFGNKYKNDSNNLIIIQINNSNFLCMTRLEFFENIKEYNKKNYDPNYNPKYDNNTVIEDPSKDGEILIDTFEEIKDENKRNSIIERNKYIANKFIEERENSKYYYYRLPNGIWVNSSFEEMYKRRVNTMKLVLTRKNIWLHRGRGVSEMHDYKTDEYEVVEMERCSLFENGCNQPNQFDEFKEGTIIDETEDIEISNEDTEKDIEKFKKQFDIHKERLTIKLDKEDTHLYENNFYRHAIVEDNVKNLIILDYQMLETLKLNKSLETIQIVNCPKLKNIIFDIGFNIKYFQISSCSSLIDFDIESKYNDSSIEELKISVCENMKSIKINNFKINFLNIIKNSLFTKITGINNVINLEIYNCPSVTNLVVKSEFMKNFKIIECNNIKNLTCINNSNTSSYLHLINCTPENIYLEYEKLALMLIDTNITSLPSFDKCKEVQMLIKNSQIEELYLTKISSLVLQNNKKLTRLSINYPNFSLFVISNCENLKSIDVKSDYFAKINSPIPNSVESLKFDCPKLEIIPSIPSNLKLLDCSGCTSLISIPELNPGIKFICNGCKILN